MKPILKYLFLGIISIFLSGQINANSVFSSIEKKSDRVYELANAVDDLLTSLKNKYPDDIHSWLDDLARNGKNDLLSQLDDLPENLAKTADDIIIDINNVADEVENLYQSGKLSQLNAGEVAVTKRLLENDLAKLKEAEVLKDATKVERAVERLKNIENASAAEFIAKLQNSYPPLYSKYNSLNTELKEAFKLDFVNASEEVLNTLKKDDAFDTWKKLRENNKYKNVLNICK